MTHLALNIHVPHVTLDIKKSASSSQPLRCDNRRRHALSCLARGTQVGTTTVLCSQSSASSCRHPGSRVFRRGYVLTPPPPPIVLPLSVFVAILHSYKPRLNLPVETPGEPGDVLTPRVPERVCCRGNEEILSPPDSNKTRLAPDFSAPPP